MPCLGVNRSCLFIINGLGLGNSTRCHAVMEYLAETGWQIHVLTSGNGLDYFQSRSCVESLTPMGSFSYSRNGSGISAWSTFWSLPRHWKVALAKRAQLAELLGRIAPDVAVIDSEYAISPLRQFGIPIIGLNTSEMVVSEYLKCRKVPSRVRGHFWLVEFSDYLFHRHNCDFVLSPYPLRAPTRHPKFRRIGLIARKELRQHAPLSGGSSFPSPRELRRVVFMLSGSVHASNICLAGRKLPFKVDVVGRLGPSHSGVEYHGRQLENVDLLIQADALVINCGYSAVSEAFVLRKPTFVVPVAGHAEQFINARLVHEFGLGFVATERDVLDTLLRMVRQNTWAGLAPMLPAFELDGAREAADIISTTVPRGSIRNGVLQ